jgi:hypothetical protein
MNYEYLNTNYEPHLSLLLDRVAPAVLGRLMLLVALVLLLTLGQPILASGCNSSQNDEEWTYSSLPRVLR